jgi:GT2 family glycosyltransferase
MKELSVVIPSKNGAEILRKYLPAIIEEVQAADGELVVVNDCSEDDTRERISAKFPFVKLIERTGEPAFCRAVNLGMRIASGKYLLLLNNDTVPERGSFAALLDSLKKTDDSIAVAVPSIPRPDGSDDSAFRWLFRRGLAVTGQFSQGHLYPSGACAMWKRAPWEKLQGFDCRYAPIYWEDTDMGVRMHNSGYSILRCPEITVKHMHAETMRDSPETCLLRERNRFIFMEANCNYPGMAVMTAFWLPLHLMYAAITGNRAFTEGYKAYRKWRQNR